MYARVVRFTGVSDETIASVQKQVEESGGPPPGVEAKSMQMLYDAGQGTALFVMYLDSAEQMKKADEVMGAMDPGETPGSRASVDLCEVVIEREA